MASPKSHGRPPVSKLPKKTHTSEPKTARRAVPLTEGRADLFEALRQQIVDRKIAPGAKLLENDLAVEFRVSRGRVREALFALERHGLIHRIPNRGAVVARLELSSVFDLYDVREVLEGLCVRLATQNVPNESWQDLVDLFSGPMVEYVAKRDFESFLAGYSVFRKRALEAANNSVLFGMLDMIYDQTQAIIRRLIVLPDRASQGLEEHRAVLAAMRRGNAEEAERLRRANMRSARESFKRFQSFVL
jgi:DNA-binding GntR family transcriptional regulator